MSQESLRFVRLTDLDWYAPVSIRESEEAMTIFARTFEELSKLQVELAELFELNEKDSFDEKKEITSAMRRVAPIGLATNIGWSCNIRTLRHVIEQRTAPWAEEEIRLVFARIAEIAIAKWPNLVQRLLLRNGGRTPRVYDQEQKGLGGNRLFQAYAQHGR